VPRFDLKHSLEDALKCLNLLGILWTGRENVTRGALYLKSAEHVYTALSLMGSALSNAIEDIHTHTLFYLAQCYGNLGNAPMSSKFCHLTLQRQLTPTAAKSSLSGDGLLDWIRNSMALSDFYFSSGDFFLYRCITLPLPRPLGHCHCHNGHCRCHCNGHSTISVTATTATTTPVHSLPFQNSLRLPPPTAQPRAGCVRYATSSIRGGEPLCSVRCQLATAVA